MTNKSYYELGQEYYTETTYNNSEDAWEAETTHRRLEGDELIEAADDFGQGFIDAQAKGDSKWNNDDEFDHELDQIKAKNNSIVVVALHAALDAANKTYIARRNAFMDVDDPAQRGTPEHLTLLREYQAAENQIKQWIKEQK